MKTFKYFVGNEWVAPISGKYFDSENPATGDVWARVPDCGPEDIDLAVNSAKRAFYEGPWGKILPAERGRVLRRMGDAISKNASRLGEVEDSKDMEELAECQESEELEEAEEVDQPEESEEWQEVEESEE